MAMGVGVGLVCIHTMYVRGMPCGVRRYFCCYVWFLRPLPWIRRMVQFGKLVHYLSSPMVRSGVHGHLNHWGGGMSPLVDQKFC